MPIPTGAQTRAILSNEDITSASKLVLIDILTSANRDGVALVAPTMVATRTNLTARGVRNALEIIAEAKLAYDLTDSTVKRSTRRTWKIAAKVLTPSAEAQR